MDEGGIGAWKEGVGGCTQKGLWAGPHGGKYNLLPIMGRLGAGTPTPGTEQPAESQPAAFHFCPETPPKKKISIQNGK